MRKQYTIEQEDENNKNGFYFKVRRCGIVIGILDLSGWKSHKHAEWTFRAKALVPSKSVQKRLIKEAVAI